MPKKSNRLAQLQQKMPSIDDPCGVRRFVALAFGFHGKCRDECRRAQNCVGAGAPCFDAFWPGLPKIRKDIYREMVKARVAGAKTAKEIRDAALTRIMAMYSREEILAAVDEMQSPKARTPRVPSSNAQSPNVQSPLPAGKPGAEPPRPEPILPRIRVL